MKHAIVYSRRGSSLHETLCDAFLDWGGYLILDDALFEVLCAEPAADGDADMWRWSLRGACAQGAA